ncbi:MAG: DUF2790 domain-containing protein [Pseudomonas sp.]|jgi:Protein of unknown function (DUF2790)|nr:MAG: DUF2790 domain-containing protein [Pseudomonas sp.]
MRIAKSLVFALAILSPMASFAFAEDASVTEILKEHQVIVEKYANKSQKIAPPIVDYKYGMKLDIAKVIRTSPDARACKVIPQLMTYEDSSGNLNTVKYQIMSPCRGKN